MMALGGGKIVPDTVPSFTVSGFSNLRHLLQIPRINDIV